MSPALAQNFSLNPTFGTQSLTAGFTPDPFTVQIQSGGNIDASSAIGTDSRGNYCVGMIADAPDFRLQYTAGSYDLTIYFQAQGDTTLVINGPNGDWYCDDDSGGFPNPMVQFNNPASGQYDIWVGTYGSNENLTGTLNISELGGPTGNNMPPASAGMPDFNLDPTFGTVNLAAGFAPQTVDIVAGGGIDANVALGTDNNGNGCYGTIAEAPDYRVQFNGTGPLTFDVTATEDTTLVINAPDGNWYCDDDGAGYPNPRITFGSAMSGQYDIWVGTYSGGGNPNTTLRITGASGGK
jgi:hypothetical protein